MPLDRRTLIAAGLSLAATPRVALAAPAVSRFPIWPAAPSCGGAIARPLRDFIVPA